MLLPSADSSYDQVFQRWCV